MSISTFKYVNINIGDPLMSGQVSPLTKF